MGKKTVAYAQKVDFYLAGIYTNNPAAFAQLGHLFVIFRSPSKTAKGEVTPRRIFSVSGSTKRVVGVLPVQLLVVLDHPTLGAPDGLDNVALQKLLQELEGLLPGDTNNHRTISSILEPLRTHWRTQIECCSLYKLRTVNLGLSFSCETQTGIKLKKSVTRIND